MLAVSPLLSSTSGEDERQVQMESFGTEEFPDLLESINFDDLFMGINDDDVLPDLEMDNSTEILAEFSAAGSTGGEEESDMNTSVCNYDTVVEDNSRKHEEEDNKINSGSGSGLDSSLSTRSGKEIVSNREESVVAINAVSKETDKGNKYSSSTKTKINNSNQQGKRKVKVDWTPELHRRFVQAVEQLGVDKAVPSRILEIMGIDCLTRHNIASHLQKYRSHRKHLLTREAEAATWSHRRQMYGAGGGGGGGGGGKRDIAHWHVPTPLTPPMHYHHLHPQFRPLHVWGHPPMEQTMYMWPKHLFHSPSPPPPPHTWPPPPPVDHSYWHFQQQQQRVSNGLVPGTTCFAQPLAPTRFGTPPPHPVPGIPPVPTRHSCPSPPPFDFYPSKESVDAAIGDVLSKPWLPLPLGLKPPSVDGVIGELQRQGVAHIPPTCA